MATTVLISTGNSIPCHFLSPGINHVRTTEAVLPFRFGFSSCKISCFKKKTGFVLFATKGISFDDKLTMNYSHHNCSIKGNGEPLTSSKAIEKNLVKKTGKKEYHLWKKKDSAGSGQKALNLIRILSVLPNEKEVVYGALNKWIAWETEFPLIAAAKALRILRKRSQWKRVIQVAKWMLSKGQGTTMGTYDTLLLAFDMDQRVDEAESFWNMILHTHKRSISKRLFSRMIALYDHHDVKDKIIEVFADMEELSVRLDEDTVRRVAYAFQKLGQEEKKKLLLRKYQCKWKYVHFKGERIRVRRDPSADNGRLTN
ncbi:pentatricopeptide repeat-containing protein At4g18975, chloroplastic [Morus notabilis]|uniref:pentatricopeptide repeat-containing protein At4g18975, chloroplastic n=1 Tax=Morus notabilis TaxID=981085 RepID=UPI000CED5E9C|nr:pentatricopeptide repeat-containing protein At4g18975, chloroplastic [Morus notabilis]